MPTALIAGIDISACAEPAVELAIPLHVAAEPERHAAWRSLRTRRRACRRPPCARDRSRRSSAARSPRSTQRSGESSGSAAARSNVTRVSGGRPRAADREHVAGQTDARRARGAAGRWRRRRRAPPSRARWRARGCRACRRGRTSRRRRDRHGPAAAASPARAARRLHRAAAPRSTRIVCCQFAQSRFSISSAIGPPMRLAGADA